MEHNRGYAKLATAIIAQAAKDWHEIETKKKSTARYTELRRFFRGEWCAMLCGDMNPKLILAKLERMTKPRSTPQKDNKKVWEPRWIEHKGEYMRPKEWAKLTGIPKHSILNRIDVLGWSVEKALTTPIRTKVKKEVQIG